MSIRLSWSLLLALPFCLCSGARADTWTNAAGKTIAAELQAVNDGRVKLRLPNGRDLSLPLSSLSKADQQRALDLVGQAPVPSEWAELLAQARRDLERAAVFLKDGKITQETYARRRAQVIDRFDQLLQLSARQHGKTLSPALVNRWKESL